MKVFIFYDVISDKKRQMIVDKLFEYSFVRIQNSVFLGDIEEAKLTKIKCELDEIFPKKKENESLYYFPLCENDFNKTVFIDKNKSHKKIKIQRTAFF